MWIDSVDEIEIVPEKTFALIIGIDQYPNLGRDWELSNTVREATEFAGWLLEKNVSANHIELLYSDSDNEAQSQLDKLVDRQGEKVGRDKLEALKDVIHLGAFDDPPPNSLLFVYWAGHGSIDDKERQLLWSYDAKPLKKWVYDLDDLRQALRSENWGHFTKQFIFVNACATEVPRPFEIHLFDALDLDTHYRRKQFTICAASPREPVPTGGANEPNEFFKLLLSKLRNSMATGNALKLDLLCQGIWNGAESLPHSPKIEWINWNGARSIWVGDPLNKLVYSKLRRCGIDQTDLENLYKDCVETPIPVNTIAEIIGHLNTFHSTAKNRLMTTKQGALLDFALRVIRCHRQVDRIIELDKEITALFEDESSAGYEYPCLVHARKLIDEEYRQPVGPLYLSVTPSNSEDTYQFYLHDSTGWKMFDDNLTREAEENFEDVFRRAIRKHEEILTRGDHRIHFHFFLRLENLFLELHGWKDPTREDAEETLERNHPVALRSLERAREAEGWKFAAVRWRLVANAIKSRNPLNSFRINWVDAHSAKVNYKTAADAHECIGYTGRPSVEDLRRALDEGLPFLIWPRGEFFNWGNCMSALCQIAVKGELCNLADHFRGVRETMNVHIAALWDDPAHNPYSIQRAGAREIKPGYNEMA